MAKGRSKKRKRRQRPANSSFKSMGSATRSSADETVPISRGMLSAYLPALFGFVVILTFAYWPTLVWMEDAWRYTPDYSHGYLVPFLVGLLCWHRRDSFPGIQLRADWTGVWFIGLAIAMRVASRFIYADFLDAWSLLPLIAGVIWLFLGRRAMLWSLPAIGFLFFMIPMPYQAETMLSWNLQGIATRLSTTMLRVLGQPAVYEGHVIWVNDERVLVEQACSGLRIFIGVAALAYFWAVMFKRSWVDRLVLLATIIPVALIVNATRITTVALFYQVFDDEVSRRTIHDFSGYLMIPVAFLLLWLLKVYWEHLYRPVEQMSAKDLLVGS